MMRPMMCGGDPSMMLWYVGIKIFLVIWIIFVPIAMTARLDKIVKLLQDKK